jgi:ribose transport system permease protein
MNLKKIDNNIIRQFTLLIVLILEIIMFSTFSDRFLAGSNFINVLRQISVTAISSVGMFMIILLGDIDLSVGAVYAFVGVLCAFAFRATDSGLVVVLIAVALGLFIGFVKGFITAKGKIPAFVTTLAVMSVCRGLANVITKGTPIGISNKKFTVLGAGYIFSFIPIPVVIMLIVLCLGYFISNYTRIGRYIYACGGNEQASRWSGLNTDRIRIFVFVFAGLLNSIAALILAGRLGGGLPQAGTGAEMDAITAVILGGTSLTGGKGKFWGVITGVIVIGVLSNGLTMLNVSSYWQEVVKGIIILIAVLIDKKALKKA